MRRQAPRFIQAAALAALLAAGVRPATAATLFEDLGGKPAVQRIVAAAVHLYLTDPTLADDFDNINPQFLQSRLAEHLCVVTDGPCEYHGRPMGPAHQGLGINEARFNAVAEDFQAAMESEGVPYHLQNRVMARLAPMHRDIVSR